MRAVTVRHFARHISLHRSPFQLVFEPSKWPSASTETSVRSKKTIVRSKKKKKKQKNSKKVRRRTERTRQQQRGGKFQRASLMFSYKRISSRYGLAIEKPIHGPRRGSLAQCREKFGPRPIFKIFSLDQIRVDQEKKEVRKRRASIHRSSPSDAVDYFLVSHVTGWAILGYPALELDNGIFPFVLFWTQPCREVQI